jgi:hypothetical protein
MIRCGVADADYLSERSTTNRALPQVLFLQQLSEMRAPQGPQKKFNSHPVVPTVFGNEPFDQDVEGLSHLRPKSCAVQGKVQTHDFEDLVFCRAVTGKRFSNQRLRKFEHLERNLGLLGSLAVRRFDLEREV